MKRELYHLSYITLEVTHQGDSNAQTERFRRPLPSPMGGGMGLTAQDRKIAPDDLP